MRALLKEILQNPLAMTLAILVHLLLAGVLFISLEWTDVPTPAQPKVDIVKAVVVDESRVAEELEKLKKAEQKKSKQEQAKQKALEKQALEAKKKREREEQRLATLRKEREAEKIQQKKLQKQREVEEQRIAAERVKKQQEVERLKTEQARLEQQRIAEEKRLADAEARRQQLEAQQRRETEAAARRAEFEAEQRRMEAAKQQRLSTLRGSYIADIQNKVERNWIRPASAREGLKCKVVVHQIPGGEVINVTVTECTGDDVFRRSVEAAVFKASPLPRPSDPDLFDREIVFNFKPKT